MATGDIRTILSMDYSQYQAGAAAGVSANRDFAKSADQLYNSIAAVQKSMDQARKFQVGTVEFGMSKQLHQNNAAADVQFQAANNRMNNELLNDAFMASQRLAGSYERLRSNTLGLATANQTLSASLRDTTFRREAGRTAFQQLMGTILQDRVATDANRRAKDLLRSSMLSGAITVKEYQQAINAAKAAQQGMAAGAGKTQMAITQLLFAADDAVTVYGTSGLSGAVRAAGNNLTMMASIMGGTVGLAAGVGGAAVVQMAIMFSGLGKAAKDAAKAVEESARRFEQSLTGMVEASKGKVGLQQDVDDLLKNGTAEQAKKEVDEARKKMEQAEAARKALSERIAQNLESSSAIGTPTRSWVEFLTNSDGANAVHDTKVSESNRLATERVEMEKRYTETKAEQLKLQEEINAKEAAHAELVAKERQAAATAVQENLQGFLSGFRQQAEAANKQHRQNVSDIATRAVDMETSISDQLDPTGNSSRKRQIAMEFKEREKFFRQNIGDNDQRRSSISQARAAALKQLADVDRVNDPHAGEGPSAVEKGSKEAAESQRQAILSSMRRDNGGQKSHEQTLENLLKQINDNSRKQKELTQKMVQAAPTPAGVN